MPAVQPDRLKKKQPKQQEQQQKVIWDEKYYA